MRFSLSTFAGVAIVALFAATADAAFDLSRRNNMVVYWGQNAHGSYDKNIETSQKDLLTYCKSTNVDLISIGFLNAWNSTGGQPVINFANSCTGYQKFPGTDLLWCPSISADILACQTLGKTILLSLGGSSNTYKGFNSSAQAEDFARKIWNMFGRGWSYYRPFGEAVVDGFDLDIETLPAQYYDRFAYRLRQLFGTDTSKKYYLTAAPQCPNKDARLNTALANTVFDAIFVQFYNNPSCAANKWTGKGMNQSTNSAFNFGMWDSWVVNTSKNKNLKVFLSLPASGKVASSGYVNKTTAANIIADLARFKSFGGAALWDASEAWNNSGYLSSMKTALNNVPLMKREFFGLW